MKKISVAAIAGMFLLAGWPLRAADSHSSEFCLKHCTAVQLRKEVSSLEKTIANYKSALRNPGGSGEKLATVIAKKEELKKHIAQHEAELKALKADTEKAEMELAQMEKQ